MMCVAVPAPGTAESSARHFPKPMTIKVLSIIEATTVTGPAKNLLKFAKLVQSPEFLVNGTPEVELSIVTFDRNTSHADNAFVCATRETGIAIDVVPERFRFDTNVIHVLRAIVARHAPDIIQTHGVKSHFLVKSSGLGRQHHWVAYHHGYTATDLKMRAYNQLNRWSLPSADRVITVCGEFAKQLIGSGVQKDRITMRHNSVVAPRNVTSDERKCLRERFGLSGTESVVVSVGRLSREKGHADLIDAMSLLRELNAELKFKLLIVGDGPELQSLQRAARRHGLDQHVMFVGHVSDVATHYAIADVMALPSHSEGSPNVLLEAMAAGVPIVATSVGGVPEIATAEHDALLVPARNPSLFAEALGRVLTELELAQNLKNNAIARASQFSPAAHAGSLIQIYQELVSVPGAIARGSNTQGCRIDPVVTASGSDTVAIAQGTDTI
jgi:glycosyltransferase involved in cell wall biosynthesis